MMILAISSSNKGSLKFLNSLSRNNHNPLIKCPKIAMTSRIITCKVGLVRTIAKSGNCFSLFSTLVELLVMNVDRSEERLNEERQKCIGPDDHDLKEVYDILLKKFKKLKKTKE